MTVKMTVVYNNLRLSGFCVCIVNKAVTVSCIMGDLYFVCCLLVC